jgi:superfamily I DNA/RNA helicase
LVEAGAGCAKTTTLEMAASRVRIPGLAVAFNKRIAQEMDKRLPGNFACKTMNSLGHSAWGRALGRPLKLDDRKGGKLVSQVAKSRRMDLSTDQWDAARSLFREAQIQGLVPQVEDRLGTSLVPDTQEGWQSLLESASSDISQDDFDLVWEITREALVENIRLARDGTVSFDDQIYCSTMLGGAFGRFPVIFLDEDQDLNPLQIRMVQQSMRPDTRLLAVGDRHQSIYAFRGAVGEAAQQLQTLRPASSWTELPLMTSFRVPQIVAARQRHHVPLFTAHGTNPPGQLHHFTTEAGWSWPELVDLLPDPGVEVAVLCRNNAPILALAFKLIRQNIGCYVLGRDIGRGLMSLLKKLTTDDSFPIPGLLARLDAWQESEFSKAKANDKPELASRISDRADCIRAVAEGTQAADVGQLKRQIERLFSKDSGRVVLSTIHKAKGLEWPAVVHLDPWRIPSKFSRGNARAMEQEANLRYVCETRTKHTLVLANLEDFH